MSARIKSSGDGSSIRSLSAILLAAAAWFAVLLQLWLSLRLAQANGRSLGLGLLMYLGYFTVLTNLFVCLVLSVPTLAPSSRVGRFFAHPQTSACAATAIALVGLGYHVLLRHIWNPEGLQWLADMMLHYLVPLLFCGYWLLVLCKASLPWWSPLAWCLYPTVYFAYALLRGVFLEAYPYPCVDVRVLGYGQVVQNAMGLMLAFALVGSVFLALARLVHRPRP